MVSLLLGLLIVRAPLPQTSAPVASAGPVTPARPGEPIGAGKSLAIVARKRWALCIGAGEYTKGLAPLKYAASDARAFAATMRTVYGFDARTLGLLADGAPESSGGTGPTLPPTSANILGELKRLLSDRGLDQGDLFVFYFSGHGVGTPSGDYLMPTDVPESEAATRGVPVRTIVKGFVDAGLKNVLIVADACRSGAKNPFGKELQDLGRRANIAVLLGCAPGQRSYESPDLEHGVFTHFLTKALGDRSLVEGGTGALWASALAKKVARQVKAYTQADYPSDPQTPAVWSEPSQDVLLAAYPPEGEAATAAVALVGDEFKGGTLDRDRYARYLSGFADSLASADRNLEAIAALKTLDGLGLATWRDLFVLSLTLRSEKRDNEVGSIVARAVREPVPTNATEFTILNGRPEFVGIARYRQALGIFPHPETFGFTGVTVYIPQMRQILGEDYATIAKGLTPYRDLYPKDSREGRYVGAVFALAERRYAEAITLAKTALAMPKGEDTLAELLNVRYEAAQALKNDAEMDAVVAEGLADPATAADWQSTRFLRMRERGDPGYDAAIRTYAGTIRSVPRMTEVVQLLGSEAGSVLTDARRVAKENPYSWQAPLNVWLAQAAADGFRTLAPFPADAEKYAPNRAELVRYALNAWDDLLRGAIRAGKIDGIAAGRAHDALVGAYVAAMDDIRDYPQSMFGLGRMFAQSSQPVLSAFFADKILWPFAKEQTYVRSELMIVSLFLAINGGNDGLAREIFARLDREEGLGPKAIVRYATYQALAGDAAESERALSRWPTATYGEPDPVARTAFAAIRAVLAARKEDGQAAIALIEGGQAWNRDSARLAQFALYEANGRKGFSPEFLAALVDPDPESPDLQIAMTVSAIRGSLALGTPEGRANARKLSVLLCAYPGHPWAKAIGFEDRSGRTPWAGETKWSAVAWDGVNGWKGGLSLHVGDDGVAEGRLTIEGEDEAVTIKGEVDERGNLTAKSTMSDGSLLGTFLMKLPTTESTQGPALANAPPIVATQISSPQYAIVLRLQPITAEATP